jgi:hypothetical protein
MQDFMRSWSGRSRSDNRATMLDQASLAWFAELNRGLTDRLDDEGFHARMLDTTAQLAELARQIVDRAAADCAGLDTAAVLAALPSPRPAPAPSLLFAAG